MKIFALFLLAFCFRALNGGIENDFSTPEKIIELIVNSNYHLEPGLKTANLFMVDPDFFENIKSEVLDLVKNNPIPALKQGGPKSRLVQPLGRVEQYSIINATGRFDDLSLVHNRSIFNKRFHHREAYPHLAKFIELFPHAVNFRINVMYANSALVEHRATACHYNKVNNKYFLIVKFHLPIKTNQEASMFLNGDLYRFEEGNIYFFYNGVNHTADNYHPTDERIHLVWDMLLTQKTYRDLFLRDLSFSELLIPTEDISVESIGYREIDPDCPQMKLIPLKDARKSFIRGYELVRDC